jgi:hypothetical protein
MARKIFQGIIGLVVCMAAGLFVAAVAVGSALLACFTSPANRLPHPETEGPK